MPSFESSQFRQVDACIFDAGAHMVLIFCPTCLKTIALSFTSTSLVEENGTQ